MKNRILFYWMIILVGISGCSLEPNESNQGNKSESEKSPPQMSAEQKEIFDLLEKKDSILFKLGFNQCDTAALRKITSDDFEFYHDQSGITNSQQDFIQSMSGLCKMSYKATRELEANSLIVHVLKNDGNIYGAIQSGKHLFYGEEENKPKYLTSTADFTHLWIVEDNEWKLKRVLSYNHQEPEN